MSDNPEINYDDGVWFVDGKARISPGGEAGVLSEKSNYRPYNLPGEVINEKDGSISSDEFVIAWGGQAKQPVTSNKWWSPALLQKRSKFSDVGQWIEDKGQESQRSRPMINEPFCMNFVDMAPDPNKISFPKPLWQHGLRLWNQSAMYVFADQPGVPVDSERFVIDNLAQPNAPIVTVGLSGVHPLHADKPGSVSNVVVDDYSEFHVHMGYGDEKNKLAIRMASGVPYVIFERVKGKAPFQLWAGSPVTEVGNNDNKDTYEIWTPKNKSALGFNLGVRFLPGPPPGMKDPDPPPRGQAAYYVVADKGTWKKQNEKYGTQEYFTWINDEATTVWVLALPHNLKKEEFQTAVDELMASPAKSFLPSGVLYPPAIRDPVLVNGEVAKVGYDKDRAKIIVGYNWQFRDNHGEKCGSPFLALFPHHRKFMRQRDMKCFLMDGSAKDLRGNSRPKYFYRTLKGEMWVYKGSEFVREFEAHGLLPFTDTVWAMESVYQAPYEALKTWFWQEEPIPGGAHCDSFAWNYFEHGGPEANPYMAGWPGIYENLIIADQLARSNDWGPGGGRFPGTDIDPDFKTTPARVAVVMREKILEVLKQLVHQWFDVYTSQSLQYNDKFATVCGYPDGYFCVSHLCDHHFHWGYFLRAAAAIGRFDRPWLDRHWPAIEMLVRDSANFDPADKRFPLQRNFSAFHGHSWANGIAFNNGQDQESTSEALNLAFGMVELATLRNDSDMLAVGLWLYEEQVCATQQYWFNVDAETDPVLLQKLKTREDLYYDGNWPKGFVHFSRKDKTGKDVSWHSTLVGIVGQQSVSKQLHFSAGTQGLYAIHMLPVGPSNLFLERRKDWLDATYRGYLQAANSQANNADSSTSPYENIIAMWQAVVTPSDSDNQLAEFERPGVEGASKRINRSHPKYAGALKSQALAWCATRNKGHLGAVLNTDVRSNAVHYGAFSRPWPSGPALSCLVYNPHHIDSLSARFWFAGRENETVKTFVVGPRTLKVFGLNPPDRDHPDGWWQWGDDEHTFRDASKPPDSRLYLHHRGGSYTLDRGLGSDADEKFQPPKQFPTDLSALQSSIADLPRGSREEAKTFEKPLVFTGKFNGKLAKNFCYTKFSLFVNPALHAGWTRDPSNPDAGVEMRITYDFGNGKKRVETYGSNAKFNLQPNNTWLNHNCLTEYATTTVPLTRGKSENPLTPIIEGDFVAEVTNGTMTLEIQKTAHTTSNSPVPVYLSLNCPHEPERASWIQAPYE
jgi:hypothetical protein